VGHQLKAERKAHIVSFGKDTGGIGTALKNARANDLQVGMRCGSHDGLVIGHSRYFKYAVVNPEKHAVRTGGCSLCRSDSRTVEDEATRYGLGTVWPGMVNHVLRSRFTCDPVY